MLLHLEVFSTALFIQWARPTRCSLNSFMKAAKYFKCYNIPELTKTFLENYTIFYFSLD